MMTNVGLITWVILLVVDAWLGQFFGYLGSLFDGAWQGSLC